MLPDPLECIPPYMVGDDILLLSQTRCLRVHVSVQTMFHTSCC